MTTFQPPTKQDIREISVGFSTFCTEEKTKSTSSSPNKSLNTCSNNNTMNRQRKIFRARRGSRNGNQPLNNNRPLNNNQPFTNPNFGATQSRQSSYCYRHVGLCESMF